MFEIDHIVVRVADRDAALERLAAATGLPILDGYAPGGRRVARGVRFANGPFLDVHQSEEPVPVFLGLSGEVRKAQTIADTQEWRSRLAPLAEGPDAEPWSLLSFRRGQGLLSRLFVVEYEDDEGAWRSPIFNGGLYHLPPVGGPRLRRVWVTASDVAAARDMLLALEFWAAGEIESPVWPHRGQVFQHRAADIVLAEGDDAVVRADVAMDEAVRTVSIGERFTVVVGREK